MTNHAINILKTSDCQSLTGRSTLTYHLGRDAEGQQYLRVLNNTGSGFFSKEWMPVADVEQVLLGQHTLTSANFKQLYAGKSVNTAGFLMAVLADLGVLQTSEAKKRHYEATSISLQQVFDGLDSGVGQGEAAAPKLQPQAHTKPHGKPRKSKSKLVPTPDPNTTVAVQEAI